MKLVNPFEVLGISRLVVERELRNGEDGLVRLLKLAGRTYQQVSQLYHPDGNERFRDKPMLEELTAARDRLTPGTAAMWAGLYTESSSLYVAQIAEWEQQEERTQLRRTAALLGLLGRVDSTAVLGLTDVEVLFGLSHDLSPTAGTTYIGTYSVRLPGNSGEGDLYKLQHPGSPEGLPELLSTEDALTWDREAGAWDIQFYLTDPELDTIIPTPAVHRHRYVSQGKVRVVGGINRGEAWGLQQAGSEVQGRQRMGLTSGANTSLSDELFWYPPARAWWLEIMTGEVGIGDIAVAARPNGQIALLGRLLTMRSLSQ